MTVAVKRVDLAEAGGRYVVVPAGFYAAISVSDTGCGIPEAIHDRIFDPFFTTKSGWRTSAGSGLGLSIVYSIVKDLDGFTDFETTEGKGSTFTVYLPLAAVSVASAEKAGS
jgi:signal transduction histidine kinase